MSDLTPERTYARDGHGKPIICAKPHPSTPARMVRVVCCLPERHDGPCAYALGA